MLTDFVDDIFEIFLGNTFLDVMSVLADYSSCMAEPIFLTFICSDVELPLYHFGQFFNYEFEVMPNNLLIGYFFEDDLLSVQPHHPFDSILSFKNDMRNAGKQHSDEIRPIDLILVQDQPLKILPIDEKQTRKVASLFVNNYVQSFIDFLHQLHSVFYAISVAIGIYGLPNLHIFRKMVACRFPKFFDFEKSCRLLSHLL